MCTQLTKGMGAGTLNSLQSAQAKVGWTRQSNNTLPGHISETKRHCENCSSTFSSLESSARKAIVAVPGDIVAVPGDIDMVEVPANKALAALGSGSAST